MKIDNPPAIDYPMSMKPALERWVMPGWSYKSYTTTTVVNGLIVYQPIFVSEDTTYDRIALYCGNAEAGKIVEMRIYTWEDGLPAVLVLDAGSVSLATTGPKQITISQLLARGYYFLAFRGDSTAAAIWAVSDNGAFITPTQGLALVSSDQKKARCLAVVGAWADPARAPDEVRYVEFAAICLREA